jgi:hypothetical protein
MRPFPRESRSPGRPRLAARVLTLAGCAAAIALAGCAAAPAAPPDGPHASAQATTAAAALSAGTPQQQAEADAARMLKAFTPPPGARPESRSPVPSSPLSTGPQGGSPEDSDVVTRTAWWLAPGGPLKLLAWEADHIGMGYHNNGSGMNGPGVYNSVYAVPAVPGLFDERQLTVSATAAGDGQVAIRVDSLVNWIPARAAGDTVPAAARVAVLTQTRDASGPGKPPVIATATLTSARQVAALAAYLNGLPVNVPGETFNCPAAFGNGGGLTVSFRARPGDPALAQASASLSGCGFLTFTVPGQPPTGLGEAEAGESLLAEVNHVTGLHWKVR